LLSTIFESPTIYDGSGGAPFVTDIALSGDRIVHIGDCRERDAVERIACAGLAVSPGSIDVHSHSDGLWLIDGRALGKIYQGVTTEIAGNCGTSVAPLSGFAYEKARAEMRTYRADVEWADLREFFDLVERGGVALNVATLIGLGTARACVSGPDDRRLEDHELRALTRLVYESVEQGAIGVSSGLIYEPGRYADERELIACARAAREAGQPLYASHIRNEGDDLIDAVREALAIGEGAEVAVQCSHHKAAGRKNWGKVHQSLELIDRARARGMAVHADVYPYVASWTELATILPDATRSGGTAATLERLRDPEAALAVQLALKLQREVEGGDTWHDILVTDVGSERNASLAGMRIDEIAERWRMSPARAAIRLLDEEDLDVQCAFFSMNEDDVATVMSAEFTCIGSDASARAFDGITARGVPHPRTYGCFPRIVGRYVRERRTFSLEEAVRRMTSLPASIFGIRDRGTLRVGAYADMVVFDPANVRDTATYERPYAKPVGIRDVFVNGQGVVRNGEATRARPGRALRGG